MRSAGAPAARHPAAACSPAAVGSQRRRGVDVALWDIYGKSLGVPIYRLLDGGVRELLPAYASGGWAPPEGTADEVLGYRGKGFKAVKIRVGGLGEPHFPQRSLERLRLGREALGPDVQLMMDAHGALTVDRAVRLGQAASEYELTWFEEPVLADDDLPGPAEVRPRLPVPVATGESETTRFAFRDIVEQRAADFLQPDVAVVGGLTDRSTPGRGAGAHAWAAGRTPRVGIGAAVSDQFAVGRRDAQLRRLRVLPGLLPAAVQLADDAGGGGRRRHCLGSHWTGTGCRASARGRTCPQVSVREQHEVRAHTPGSAGLIDLEHLGGVTEGTSNLARHELDPPQARRGRRAWRAC